MQAIKVQIYFSEWEKVSDFISEINIDEEMAAYAIDNRTMVIATVGECSMAYAKAQLKTWFSDPTIELNKKNMKKRIVVEYGKISQISKDFKVTRQAVYKALNYLSNSSKATLIRKVAIERGGVEIGDQKETA